MDSALVHCACAQKPNHRPLDSSARPLFPDAALLRDAVWLRFNGRSIQHCGGLLLPITGAPIFVSGKVGIYVWRSHRLSNPEFSSDPASYRVAAPCFDRHRVRLWYSNQINFFSSNLDLITLLPQQKESAGVYDL